MGGMNIFHCCERHEDTNPQELTRKRFAWDSWDVLYGQGVIPVHYWAPYGRDATSLGDRRPLPFLKDVLQKALDQATEKDIIFFTNDDNWLHPELPDMLKFQVGIYGVCTARRTEFKQPFPRRKDLSPDDISKAGEHHIGRDLFAATQLWLTNHWSKIGDFVLGEPLFDLALASLVRNYFGYRSDRRSLLHANIFPCELPQGYVAHQFHTPRWTKFSQGITPSKKRNSDCYKELAAEHSLPLTFNSLGDI